MKAKLARLGDSLAVCLPDELVREFGFEEGQVVEVTPKAAGLEVGPEEGARRRPNGIPSYTMEELLADMKPENEPPLLDWGPDRGSEVIDDDYSRGKITLDDVLSGRAAKGR
jgi:antitoxin MazE